jgi:hypothetical protein
MGGIKSMTITKKLIFIFLVLFFSSSITLLGQASELITITRSAFCLNINNREPVNKISGTVNIAANESIYFWMEFIGRKDALAMLEKTGELKIWHKWRKGMWVTDRIMVGINQEKWEENQEQIRLEFNERGFFTWRTCSFKKINSNGKRKVKIYDDKGDVISPQMDSQINIVLN